MKNIKHHVRQYSRFLYWLVGDLYKNYRWRLSWVLSATFIGLSMQMGSVYVGYRYAKALENNSVFTWLGWEFVSRSSFPLLMVVASVVMLMIIVSAVLVMSGRREGLQLARDYTDYCSRRAYVVVSKLVKNPVVSLGKPLDPQRIAQLTGRDSNYAGIIVRVLSFSLLNFGTTVVAGLALIYIDASLSMIIIFLLGLTAVFFYRNSIRGASFRSAMEKYARGSRIERDLLTNRVTYSPGALDVQDASLEEVFGNGDCYAFSQAFVKQRQMLEESIFLAQLVAGASIFLIILVQGNATIEQGSDWSALLIYLVAFGLFATNFARTARMFASINRFYPAVNGYSKFMKEFIEQPGARHDNAGVDAELFLEIDGNPVKLTRGEPIAFASVGPVDNFKLLLLSGNLFYRFESDRKDYGKKYWLISSRQSMLKSSLRESLAIPDSLSREAIKRDIHRIDSSIDIEDDCLDLNKLLTEKDVTRFGPVVLCLLKLVSGKHSDRDIIVIDHESLQLFSEGSRAEIFHYLCDKIIILAYCAENIENLGGSGECWLLFTSDLQKIELVDLVGLNAAERQMLQDRFLVGSRRQAGLKNELSDEELDEDY